MMTLSNVALTVFLKPIDPTNIDLKNTNFPADQDPYFTNPETMRADTPKISYLGGELFPNCISCNSCCVR